jgi:uncharacterized membrane protein
MSVLRFLMVLALVVWLGGIIFFAFVLAPSVFAVLPTRELAGNVVNRTLTILHWMGIASGLLFLTSSMLYAKLATGRTRPLAPRHVLIVLMLVLTLISQLGVSRRMSRLRAQIGTIDTIPQTDPRRMEFNHLHGWSTRLEGTVLVLGMGVLYLAARE